MWKDGFSQNDSTIQCVYFIIYGLFYVKWINILKLKLKNCQSEIQITYFNEGSKSRRQKGIEVFRKLVLGVGWVEI